MIYDFFVHHELMADSLAMKTQFDNFVDISSKMIEEIKKGGAKGIEDPRLMQIQELLIKIQMDTFA